MDIPGEVDTAVILVPARFVPDVLEDCGKKGIHTAIIETAGFREYSDAGKQIEDRLVEVAAKYGIQFVGPNCIGVINMESGFCVPFPRLTPFVRKGDVSLISQSGGVGLSIMNHMAVEGIGLNKFVSAGNMLNLDAEDLLEYLIEYEGTRIIFIYLESIRDGRRLMNIARRSPKPILVFKSNIGKLGQSIAASHTASLSSDDKVVEAAFRQCGIKRVHDVTTLSDYMKTLRLPPLKNKRLAIVSRSGGHAIVAADACELAGFQLAEFAETFIREIETHFRASVIKLTNPLDLGDLFDLDVYHRIVQETLPQDNVDGVVFLHTSVAAEHEETKRLIGRLEALCHQYNKPVALYLSASSEEITKYRRDFEFPIFTRIVEMFRALKLNFKHTEKLTQASEKEIVPKFDVDQQNVHQLVSTAQHEKRDLLLDEAVEVLESYGIATMCAITATNAQEARKAADTLGYPVAMKLISEYISHKSDVGGVQLNLRDGSAVIAAYQEMARCIDKAYPACGVDGVLVQPMAVGGRELIAGGHQDKQFGPVVMVGLGGIYVEIFKQAAMRIAPISKKRSACHDRGIKRIANPDGGTRSEAFRYRCHRRYTSPDQSASDGFSGDQRSRYQSAPYFP